MRALERPTVKSVSDRKTYSEEGPTVKSESSTYSEEKNQCSVCRCRHCHVCTLRKRAASVVGRISERERERDEESQRGEFEEQKCANR